MERGKSKGRFSCDGMEDGRMEGGKSKSCDAGSIACTANKYLSVCLSACLSESLKRSSGTHASRFTLLPELPGGLERRVAGVWGRV